MTVTRLWRGRTASLEDADAYEELLRAKVLPEVRGIEGYTGARVLRRNLRSGAEFVVITTFDSMEAVKAFAGDDPDVANVSPEARELLSEFEERAAHYETVLGPEG